ncbi:MAG: sugar transferase [Gammaproteobacteria bacterium]|nr:sugar transferase [Gammaproteobacteria bacterium]
MAKRLLDVLFSSLLMLILLPFLCLLALVVRVNLGKPILFSQIRPGIYGRPFRMFKFRTMTDACDENGNLLADTMRITKTGKWLRATSLDELPELFNVLKGEMSLVGPRPLLMSYLELYNHRQATRNNVKPGLTGWAQIKGRNSISWDEKLELDAWYVENRSFWLDLKILAKTIVYVLKRDGINHGEGVTMPFFTGSSKKEQ